MHAPGELERLYKKNGFFWNSFLEAFVRKYGGLEVSYPNINGGANPVATFCEPIYINLGFKKYQFLSEFIGEKMAIVGTCDSRDVKLFLTESGRLIGVADHLWLRWGEEGELWQTSIDRLLAGEEPIVFSRPDE